VGLIALDPEGRMGSGRGEAEHEGEKGSDEEGNERSDHALARVGRGRTLPRPTQIGIA
jgi:hypothetical protein